MAFRRGITLVDEDRKLLTYYKVLVMGAAGSGKTSFLNRAIKGVALSRFYKSTHPSDLYQVKYEPPSDMSVEDAYTSVQYWDVSTGDHSETRMEALCKTGQTSAVLLMVDLSDKDSLLKAGNIVDMFKASTTQLTYKIPIFLIGTKADERLSDKNTDAELREFCRDRNLKNFVVTSAKVNPNNQCQLLLDGVSNYCHKPLLKQWELERQQLLQQQQQQSQASSLASASDSTSASLSVAKQAEDEERRLLLQLVAAFKTFYRAISHANTGFEIFKSNFLEAEANQTPAAFWFSILWHATEDPESRTNQAYELAIKYYEDVSPRVELLKEVHLLSLGLFSRTKVNEHSRDEDFLQPPQNTRRAGILLDLTQHERTVSLGRSRAIN